MEDSSRQWLLVEGGVRAGLKPSQLITPSFPLQEAGTEKLASAVLGSGHLAVALT